MNYRYYHPNPKTLEELIEQCQIWDGDIIQIIPSFNHDNVLNYVTIIIKQGEELCLNNPDTWEQNWKYVNGKWKACSGNNSDPCINGGSVLTGRDF